MRDGLKVPTEKNEIQFLNVLNWNLDVKKVTHLAQENIAEKLTIPSRSHLLWILSQKEVLPDEHINLPEDTQLEDKLVPVEDKPVDTLFTFEK